MSYYLTHDSVHRICSDRPAGSHPVQADGAHRIDAATRLIRILGHPVHHSLSPRMHNAALRAQGIHAIYVELDVPPSMLPSATEGLRTLNVMGANVTLPHKEAVMPLLDTLSERARVVGAVNTIIVREGILHGDNTDVAGFTDPLLSYAEALRGRRAVVLGAGGASRAVVYALLTTFSPVLVTVVARRHAPAAKIAHDMAPYGNVDVTTFDDAEDSIRQAKLIVNATPVGMHPHSGATPWQAAEIFTCRQMIYDLVYRPKTTRLMQEAVAQGAQALGGLPMLVGQAAEAYRSWTGRTMPRAIVEAELGQYG